MALKYAELAAERGVRNAAAAVANALVQGPDHVRWLEAAVGPSGPQEAEEEAAAFPGTHLLPLLDVRVPTLQRRRGWVKRVEWGRGC